MAEQKKNGERDGARNRRSGDWNLNDRVSIPKTQISSICQGLVGRGKESYLSTIEGADVSLEEVRRRNSDGKRR